MAHLKFAVLFNFVPKFVAKFTLFCYSGSCSINGKIPIIVMFAAKCVA